MKLRIEQISENPTNTFRRAGYQFQRHAGDQMSFIRPFAASGYPRFHVYCKLEGKSLIINLHLDQKKYTYGDDTRHHGEYDESPQVQQEAERLHSFFQSSQSSQDVDDMLV